MELSLLNTIKVSTAEFQIALPTTLEMSCHFFQTWTRLCRTATHMSRRYVGSYLKIMWRRLSVNENIYSILLHHILSYVFAPGLLAFIVPSNLLKCIRCFVDGASAHHDANKRGVNTLLKILPPYISFVEKAIGALKLLLRRYLSICLSRGVKTKTSRHYTWRLLRGNYFKGKPTKY